VNDPLEGADQAATPLTAEEREQLLPDYITLRAELNEVEQVNILDAEDWAFSRQRDVLSEPFVRDLHRHMFNRIWRWAGRYRRSARNIGVDVHRIPMELRQLLDDCRYWIEHGTYEADEIAARFHHRLVQIHPFPNGNGRHARMMADLLLVKLGQRRFTWGRTSLIDASTTRQTYVQALRAADHHDYGPLLHFVRS
jgi:Fic-DOC domain mobile mystery protein B